MDESDLDFLPWENTDILEKLRAKFYPSRSYQGPDMRKTACREALIWNIRAGLALPSAIDSTRMLTEAILNDNPDTVSPSAIGSMYGTAFSRFVTLLVDGMQKRSHKENMYDVGLNIGLPKRFVEFRHEINHGKMPSLAMLRTYAQQALTWLYHDYWKHLGSNNKKVEDSHPSRAFSVSIEKALVEHRIKCLRALISGEPPMKAASDNKHSAERICSEIVKFCRNDITKLHIVIKHLLAIDMLLPVREMPGSDMKTMFRVWLTLLTTLSRKQNNFLHELTGNMVAGLVAPLYPQIKHDGHRECIGQWLIHIYTDKNWKKARDATNLKIGTLMDACLGDPCFWTLHVALAVITKKVWKKSRPLFETKILEAMEADKSPIVEAKDGDTMETGDGADKVAEGPGADIAKNDEPAPYGLDTIATALLAVEDKSEVEEEAAETPSALTYTLCIRTVKNPWYSQPIGTFK